MQYQQPVKLLSSRTKSETYFRALRWQGKRHCPACNFKRKLYSLPEGRFQYARCSFKFSDFSGTYLERLRIPFDELAHILYLFVLGVPSYRARRYINTALKTAQRLYLVFRHAIYDACIQQMTQSILDGEIEVDESMYGGHRKGKRGWGAAGKHVVFGMYQRNGFVFTFPVPDRSISSLIPLVQKHSHAGSLYYSDDWHAYTRLAVKGNHVVIVKDKGVPRAKGRDHINGIEGFWSFSKNWLYQYRGIPQHHFPLYLKETEYRFNCRDKDLFLEIAKLVTQTRCQ